MKVFNLRCGQEHPFEGWFASEAEFLSQQERGLVACPVCGASDVARMPSAPRLHLAAARGSEPVPAAATAAADLHKLYLKAVRRVIESTEDVGERFPEEARRIHYGEVDARGIRGRATAAETEALREEGIEVTPLPLPAALRGPLQ